MIYINSRTVFQKYMYIYFFADLRCLLYVIYYEYYINKNYMHVYDSLCVLYRLSQFTAANVHDWYCAFLSHIFFILVPREGIKVQWKKVERSVILRRSVNTSVLVSMRTYVNGLPMRETYVLSCSFIKSMKTLLIVFI